MNRKLDDEELKACTFDTFNLPFATVSIAENSTIPREFVKTFSKNSSNPFAYDKMLGTTTRRQFLLKAKRTFEAIHLFIMTKGKTRIP